MDIYTLLIFTHVVGFILIFAGVLAIFLSEWQTFTTDNVHVFAAAARFNLIFRNSLIAPGSIVIIVTGVWLVLHLDLGFFQEPWLIGMWGLFLFEFIEANLIARRHNRQTLKVGLKALETGLLTPEDRRQAHGRLGVFTHFLDVPLTTVMVYCGVARPENWTKIGIAVAIALAIAVVLSATVPRIHRRTGVAAASPRKA